MKEGRKEGRKGRMQKGEGVREGKSMNSNLQLGQKIRGWLVDLESDEPTWRCSARICRYELTAATILGRKEVGAARGEGGGVKNVVRRRRRRGGRRKRERGRQEQKEDREEEGGKDEGPATSSSSSLRKREVGSTRRSRRA